MDSLKIQAGVRLAINGDPSRVVAFNPSDVGFVERLYQLFNYFEAQQAEYERRAAELDAVTEQDANGLPANIAEHFAFMREVCAAMHAQIDSVFGAGTAQTVFEGALDMDMIAQFFDGVLPYIQKTRDEKLAKYARPGKGGKVMRRR